MLIHLRRGSHRVPVRVWLPGLLVLALVAAGFLVVGSAGATTCQNLVRDGGFESGTGWTMQSQGKYTLLSDYLVYAGAQAAYLGGVNNAQDSMATTVQIPDGAATTLRFRWQVRTEENAGAYDGMSILVADAQGNPLRAVYALSDANASSTWQTAQVDLSEFAGQTVQIRLQAQTDTNLPTGFFVDELVVEACSAPSGGFFLFLPSVNR